MERIFAQNLTLPDGSVISGPVPQFQTLADIINKALPYVFAFSGIGLLLMIISSGFTMLTSAGDSKKLDTGKQRLTHALTGIIIIVLAYWITQIVGRIFGFSQIILDF